MEKFSKVKGKYHGYYLQTEDAGVESKIECTYDHGLLHGMYTESKFIPSVIIKRFNYN